MGCVGGVGVGEVVMVGCGCVLGFEGVGVV